MIAQDLINYMIPPLKPGDPVIRARQWMDEMRLSELPVVDNDTFLGILDADLIFDEEYVYASVGEYPLMGKKCCVPGNSHYYDILKTSNIEGCRTVAITDEHNHYLGVVSIEDLVGTFAQNSSVNTPGAILGIKLTVQDYSLAEISRIVESNDAKILSSYLSPHPANQSDLHLTLKINTEEVSHIIASLEKNGFIIENSFNTRDSSMEEKERIDILMKYLKI